MKTIKLLMLFTFSLLLASFNWMNNKEGYKIGNNTTDFKLRNVDDNYKNATQAKVKYVEKAIEALLKYKKPVISETKAIGCSIKV